MKIGGQWVGYGLGDTGETVAAMKDFLRRKFSYAAGLAPDDIYDDAMVAVVVEMQARYGLPASGIMNYATQLRCGFVKPRQPTHERGTLFTCQGTGVDMWTGPPADTARAVTDLYFWQPVGNWPAAPFPMGPSIDAGRAELNVQIDAHPGDISMAGYSQGAMVVALTYMRDILPADGRLHHRLPDVKRVVTWGNPCRQQGKANGNKQAGWPIPEGHGVNDWLLTETPDSWLDYAHGANSPWGRDFYTDVQGDWGEDCTAICKFVMGQNIFAGPDSLLAQVIELVQRPIPETIAMFQAIINAGMFFAAQTGPHLNYDIGPAIAYLRS
ncbi:peptidoglycan-binding domain-containing protein [Mycobacterium marinum]|uniref:peptidoglycan-binding domain-containing protein n=1 Tax=Mycobacterium marinum TaxID=1781 RepID=UPI000B967B24|nr:peptidoglycan-binding domain-containing protein [Mycobacterium marinum]